MLAYAFWHWRRPDVPAERYESHQRSFQSALAEHPPRGFKSASTVRLSGAPWAAGGNDAYEDWYLVRGMRDLEQLNEAAVTAARRDPHDAVAQLAAGGVAGLYGLKAGVPLPIPILATWFAKPAGMAYPALLDGLGPLVSATRGALWMRQMVLGPAPEFCLHTTGPVELPPEYAAASYTRFPVWPEEHPRV